MTTHADLLGGFDVADVGLPSATPVPCLGILDQIAQKIHAVTDPASKNRYRDYVDIMLLECLIDNRWDELRLKCERLFVERARHVWPPACLIPRAWNAPLAKILKTDLQSTLTIDDLLSVVNSILARILAPKVDMNATYRYGDKPK